MPSEVGPGAEHGLGTSSSFRALDRGQESDSQQNRRCDISGPTVEHIASAVHASGSSEKIGPDKAW